MIGATMLGITEAITYEAGRLMSVAVILLGLVIAWKVVRDYMFSGFKAVLASIVVGGIALWGIVAGPDFFRDQASKEADAIINQGATNTPAITVPND